MPNWKKLLSSGSSGSLSNLVVDNHISASVISGSFYGDGSGLTGVTADGTISSSAQVNITQTEGYSTFSSSIQTYTDAKVAGLVDSAPGTLDTLNELAAALGDDATFSASIATSIGNRVLTSTFNTYSGSAHTQREALKYTDDKVKAKLNSDGVVSGSYVESLPAGAVSGSSQVTLTGTTGYTSFSSSVQTYTDAKITALSSSVDTHLDSNITSLSSSAHTDRAARISSLSGSAHTQRVAIASSIPTNNNQLTNGAGYITSIDGAISGSSQVTISDTAGYTSFSSSIQTYTNAKVAALVDSAPATLDTLNELAAALNDDPNFSASIATSIGNKVSTSTFNTYSGSSAAALRAEYTAAIPTNNNQLTNGAGYITSFDITTQTDSKYLRSDTSDTMAGVLTLSSTNDNQLILNSSNTWTGIAFDDGDAAAADYIWHYGATGTFALGGGGSTTSGKKLHVHGGASIGANAASTSMPTNGLYVEGELQLGSSFKAGTNVSAGYYQDSTNGAYRAITTSGDVGYYYQTNAGGSTKMYIGLHGTYAGKVGINSQTPGAVLDVHGSTAGETVFEVTGTNGTLFSVDDSLTGELFSVADSSAVPIFSVNSNGIVSVSGDFQVSGDITAYYASDERLKKNIKPIDSPLEKLKLISGNTFEWDEENLAHNNKGKDVGVIAQEIEKVLPELVGERRGYKAVQYEKIVALLIESNKALLQRVEELESKLS